MKKILLLLIVGFVVFLVIDYVGCMEQCAFNCDCDVYGASAWGTVQAFIQYYASGR